MKRRMSGTQRAALIALAAIALGALGAVVVTALGRDINPAPVSSRSTASPTGASTTTADAGRALGTRPAPIVYRPPNLSLAKPVPLVVALHGSGSDPATFEAVSGLNAVANQHGFAVAYLGSAAPTSPAWRLSDMSRNLAYISSEIASLTMTENIDPKRVYVTGFSAGATMAFFVGCQLSSRVDGIAPVSGAMRFKDPCQVSHPVSELEIIGTRDLIPIGGSARLLSDAQVAARWRTLDGCSSRSSTAVTGPARGDMWTRCDDGSGVGLYVIRGGTHQWPGPGARGSDSQFTAAEAVWAFFAAHPGTSSTHASARLLSLRARVHNRDREVRATLGLGSSVQALVTLTAHRRVVVSNRVALPRAAAASLVLLVPRHARRGRYTIKLVFQDAYGRHLTIARTIGVPSPPR